MLLNIASTVPPLIQALAAAFMLGASGLGGLIKFGVWWKERNLVIRIESATALAEKGATDWERLLGQRLLTRAHFARLTGIDVPDGHQSLLKLHDQLGGTDSALALIKRAAPHLDRQLVCAKPRRLNRRDWAAGMASTLFCLVFAALAIALLALAVDAIDRIDWAKGVPASKFIAISLAVLYAGGAALFARRLLKEVSGYLAIRDVRLELASGARSHSAHPGHL